MILDDFDQEILADKGGKGGRPAEQILLEHYGKKYSPTNARKYLAGIRMHLKLKQRRPDPKGQGWNEMATKGDGSKTTQRMVVLSESDANDPMRIMQLMGYDPLKWELVSCKTRRNDWDVTMKLGPGKGTHTKKETNHQYRIDLTVKPIQTVLSTDYIQQVFEELTPPDITPIKYQPGRMLFELPIMDVHLNKDAWKDVAGEDYDLEIAERQYRETVLDLVSRLDYFNLPVERAAFPVGQDFFHVDNGDSTTTKGTRVDSDTVWQKMYKVGVELLIWTVELLRQRMPVDVVYVPGNHDRVLSYCATYTLAAQYRNCDAVNVDLSPSPRKYIRYGKNLIGYSHGKEGKRIQFLMQQERPKDWGETVFREWHLGDLHHEEAAEYPGLKVRRISSVTASDAWHAEGGFRSLRMAQAFVWDKEKGRQFVFDSNVMV